MPIKNLQLNQTAQFPVIGKLRKGSPKTENNGKSSMGKDLEYFRFDSDDTEAVKAFAATYGDKPKQIRVLLPFATPEQNFTAWMEEYSAGGMQRRCDGESQVFHRDAKTGKAITNQPKPCERICGGACACKQTGRLYVIIPELARLAYVIVETHSIYDIVQLTQNLQAAHTVRGSLNGVPFLLSRRKREISTPGDDGKRVRRTKNLLFLEPDPEWVQKKLLAMRNEAFALLPSQSSAVEPMYTFVDESTGEVLDDEGDEEDGNPYEGTVSRSPALERLVGAIDKLFGPESTAATTWLIGGWCRQHETEIRTAPVQLSDDECDAIADALMRRGETIKKMYVAEKQPVSK